MTKKSAMLCVLAAGAVAVCGAAALGMANKAALLGADQECVWNHYSGVASSYIDSGSKEYWICCAHHETVFEQPSAGTITDMGTPSDEFVKGLAKTDARYDIKGTDHIISIAPNSIQSSAGKHTWASKESYTGVTKIEVDMKWVNATKTSWFGFAQAANISSADIYGGEVRRALAVENDGAWHHKSIDFSSTDGYLYFMAAAGEFNAEARLYMKNLTVVSSAGTEVEPAKGVGEYWRSYYNSEHPGLTAPGLALLTEGSDGTDNDMCMRITPNDLNPNDGKVNIRGMQNLKGIQDVTFEYKIEGAEPSGTPWFGWAITGSFDSLNVYNVFGGNGNREFANMGGSVEYDGAWHTKTVTFSGTEGYLYFGAAVGEFTDGTNIYIDNIQIKYYWNNCYVTETFNQDCPLFNADASIRGNGWTTVARA